METDDEQYKDGFNIGYWLGWGDTQVQKDILKHLIERQHPEISYAKGLVAGKKQMEREKMLEQIKVIGNSKDLDREREM